MHKESHSALVKKQVQAVAVAVARHPAFSFLDLVAVAAELVVVVVVVAAVLVPRQPASSYWRAVVMAA
jgi:hypothetical protein